KKLIISSLSILKNICKQTGSTYLEFIAQNSKSISFKNPYLLIKTLCLFKLLWLTTNGSSLYFSKSSKYLGSLILYKFQLKGFKVTDNS
ncbi:putative lipoprotein, partial [Chlamydia psittaci 02DC21]